MSALECWDISADHTVPSTTGITIAGFRACLGVMTDAQLASNPAQSFIPQLAETLRKAPGIVTQDYTFLAGPGRGIPISSQIAFYALEHRAELSCLDWEEDAGPTWEYGHQSFAAVLAGVKAAQSRYLNPGVYASLSLFTTDVVTRLIAAGVPYLWIAAYGIAIPDWIIAACRKAKPTVVLMHQYSGTGVDRSRVLVGTLADLHRIAGRQPAGGAVKFLQISGAERDALPTIAIPKNTPIEDLAGTAWTTLGPTNLHVLPGLPDAHSNRRLVVIDTGRFYADGTMRPTAQVAVLPKK